MVGGGHAGVEAAWAAANLLPGPGTVALVTIDPSKIGVMSCNPAIGGLAKGQLVREVDALGGVMGLAADATGIQFKVLNTSKGPAVHGPRAQCDKHAYAEAVRLLVASRAEIRVVAGAVEALLVEGGRCVGVRIGTGRESVELRAEATVLTTGTFMRGLMHTGDTRREGGRHGEAAAVGISGALATLGFELGRLKTGTPPRLRRGSIEWEALEPQWGDARPTAFSDLTEDTGSGAALPGGRGVGEFPEAGRQAHGPEAGGRGTPGASELAAWAAGGFVFDRFPLLPQVECRQTSTNASAHEIIRGNLHRAPMYSGQIDSVGPRYCPSIEDKVVRFAERESHGVFLEPESLRDDWVYCNGISTSLPADVQDSIVRSMPGCERAEILRYGYAVEYDMVRPHQIVATGETRLVRGLFLAGQINGTSGYEEAAAQGLVAGVNAAHAALGRGEWTLGREQAYVGVLMDDLVCKTPVEPYRMFTSRAEHRLLLRADNAADRLTPIAEGLGMLASTALGRRRSAAHARRVDAIGNLHARIDGARVEGKPLGEVMRRAEFELEDLGRVLGEGADRATDSPRVGASVACSRRGARASAGPEVGGTPEGHGLGGQPQDRPTGGTQAEARALMTVFADRRYAPYLERQRMEVRRQEASEGKRLPEGIEYERMPHLRTEARLALARFRPRTFGQAGRLEGITPADLTLLAVMVEKWTRTSAAGAAGGGGT